MVSCVYVTSRIIPPVAAYAAPNIALPHSCAHTTYLTMVRFSYVLILFFCCLGTASLNAVPQHRNEQQQRWRAPVTTDYRSTYYIHEYHVHGIPLTEAQNSSTTLLLETGKVVSSSGEPLVPQDEVLRERDAWQAKVEALTSSLKQQKQLIVNTLLNVSNLSTVNIAEFNDIVDHLNTSDDQVVYQTLIQFVIDRFAERKVNPDPISNTVTSDPRSVTVPEPGIRVGDPRDPTTAHTKPPSGDKERRPKASEPLQRGGDVSRNVSSHQDPHNPRNSQDSGPGLTPQEILVLTEDSAKLRKEVADLSKKYLHLYKTNKRLSLSQKRIRVEWGRERDRSRRESHASLVHVKRVEEDLKNQSVTWNDMVKKIHEELRDLKSKVDECEELIQSLHSNPPLNPSNTNHSEEVIPGTRPQIPADQPKRGEDLISPQVMTDAGVRVSQWYLDKLNSQRPKGM